MNQNIRRIAHLDMDAFYASVELLRYPELRGHAVVIGGGTSCEPRKNSSGEWIFSTLATYAGRGVATTSTYEARALGVHSAMGLMKAAKLAPEAVLLPTDFNRYRHYSRLFKSAVGAIAPTIEDRGIDEIFMDLTGRTDDIRSLVGNIQRTVLGATGLSCSIGVAPNKLLAKICSDLEKPNGLTILEPADIQTRIWPLAVSKINGIGPKASAKLAQLDIHTIQELACADLATLQTCFGGTYSRWLSRVANGIDDRPVTTWSAPRSISRETTFDRDLHAIADRDTLTPLLTQLCDKVAADLVRKGYVAKTIGIKLRFSDFSIVTRDVTLPAHTDTAATIRKAAGECLRRVHFDQRLRLLGIRVSGLAPLATETKQAPAKQAVQCELKFIDEQKA